MMYVIAVVALLVLILIFGAISRIAEELKSGPMSGIVTELEKMRVLWEKAD